MARRMPQSSAARGGFESQQENAYVGAAPTYSGSNANKRHPLSDVVFRPAKRTKAEPLAKFARLKVLVFGNGEAGELGLGTEITEQSSESAKWPRVNHLLDPFEVGVTQVAVGGMHCAALTYDGKIITWGVNDSKALGRNIEWTEHGRQPNTVSGLNPLESTPAAVENLDGIDSKVVQVVACDNATFVLTAIGTVYGWGTFCGGDGAFGFSKEHAVQRKLRKPFQLTPVKIPVLPATKVLAAGVNHMLALTRDGTVYSWGSGQQAELGRRVLQRHLAEALVPRPIALPKRSTVKIFAGFHHNFAIDKAGSIWSWALNNFGQTGHSPTEGHLHIEEPRVVENLAPYNIQHIAPGYHHSLACASTGEVLAWGCCDDNQLGIDLSTVPPNDIVFDDRGRPRFLKKPSQVPGLTAHFVAAGIDNSFAIDGTGKVWAWGFSENFRTGLGTEHAVEVPTALETEATAGVFFTFAGSRGQFSVIAGPARL